MFARHVTQPVSSTSELSGRSSFGSQVVLFQIEAKTIYATTLNTIKTMCERIHQYLHNRSLSHLKWDATADDDDDDYYTASSLVGTCNRTDADRARICEGNFMLHRTPILPGERASERVSKRKNADKWRNKTEEVATEFSSRFSSNLPFSASFQCKLQCMSCIWITRLPLGGSHHAWRSSAAFGNLVSLIQAQFRNGGLRKQGREAVVLGLSPGLRILRGAHISS